MSKLTATAFLLWSAAGISCAHVSRKPAQFSAKSDPTTCREAFDVSLDLEPVRLGREQQLRDFSMVLAVVAEKFPAMIQDFMARAADHPACEDERNVKNFAAEIQYRLDYVFTRIDQFGNEDQVALALKESSLPMQYIAQLCPPAELKERLNKKNAEYENLSRQLDPRFEALKHEFEKAFTMLKDLRRDYAHFQATRKAAKCAPLPVPVWRKNLNRSLVRIGVNFGHGSGFYVAAPDGRFLVTASHVTGLSTINAEQDVQLSSSETNIKKKDPLRDVFYLEPGYVDQGRDITFKKIKTSGPFIPVVKTGERPELNQKFYLTGFPSVSGGKLLGLQCLFKGFSDGPQGKDVFYAMECPGRPDIKGMSGGAAVGSDGRVWGVVVSTQTYTSFAYVAPLSSDEAGNLKLGIQQNFISDLCYDRHDIEPHRCQVMPNMYEENVP